MTGNGNRCYFLFHYLVIALTINGNALTCRHVYCIGIKKKIPRKRVQQPKVGPLLFSVVLPGLPNPICCKWGFGNLTLVLFTLAMINKATCSVAEPHSTEIRVQLG